MISPMHGKRPPYDLLSNVVYFHDWRYVSHGGYRWVDEEGQRIEDIKFESYGCASNIATGSIITEEIFGWPGIGREIIQAIRSRDFPMVQGCVLLIAATYVAVNTATDVAYTIADPRVRLDER